MCATPARAMRLGNAKTDDVQHLAVAFMLLKQSVACCPLPPPPFFVQGGGGRLKMLKGPRV